MVNYFNKETFIDFIFGTWTYIIIKLLKTYPKTYADFSAYDYDKAEHRRNFMKIFRAMRVDLSGQTII